MNSITFFSFAAATFLAAVPASAVTLDHGVVVFTQADALAGNVTPGDAPGFPVTISRPGSYRLASALTVTTQANGIEVRANEVTIDMGGFTLAGSGTGRNGIASFNRTATIQNGSVRGFTFDGIRTIAGFLAVNNVVVTANARAGIWVDAVNGTNDLPFTSIRNSKVVANGSGINCGSHCLVENCIVSQNGGTGIYFERAGGIALGNTVVGNSQTGIYFLGKGGAGNNVVFGSAYYQIAGNYIPMQPNACDPVGCGAP